MVYNEKTKRVIILLIATVMLLTAIPLDVFAINQEGHGPSQEDLDNSKAALEENILSSYAKSIKESFSAKGIDSINVYPSVYFEGTTMRIVMKTYLGNVYLGEGESKYNYDDGGVALDENNKEFMAAIEDASRKATENSIIEIAKYSKRLEEKDIVNIIESIILTHNTNNNGSQIGYEILTSPDGSKKIKLSTSSGESVYVEITEGMTVGDLSSKIQSEIQKLINALNEELKDLSGNEYFVNLYGEYITPNQVPLVYGAGGRVNVWTKGVQKEYLQTYEIPNVKDKMGNPIKLPIYGAPFGRAGDGTYRFLGYSPMGDPITNPFFRNDKEANVKFWGREKFKFPWTDPKLKTIMATSRYKVDLREMPDIDGNDELNPLIWMGLQEYWSGYINDPAEEKNDWINHVKFQIPPTDDTWGLAYFPSKLADGSFWYATIPIVKKSMLGIDIKTETIVATPAIVTGRKGKYPYSSFKC